MVRRLASLSGMGMMVGLLCMIPSTVKISLALVRQEEPVRWVTLPWGLPSSSLLAVTAHTAAPLATGLGLGLLAGLAVALVGLALVPTSQHRHLHRSYWDVSLLTFFLCFAPLWSRLWGVVRWLTGGAGSPVDLHGSLWPRGLPLAAAVGRDTVFNEGAVGPTSHRRCEITLISRRVANVRPGAGFAEQHQLAVLCHFRL